MAVGPVKLQPKMALTVWSGALRCKSALAGVFGPNGSAGSGRKALAKGAGAHFSVGALLFVGAAFLIGCSCEEKDEKDQVLDADGRNPVTGLTPTEEKEVLVTVGERDITLGDFVATLLRMDRFERLRYQTEERQKMLLDEMIEVELLAQEAKRRGLDKDPEVALRVQQALRDELLRELEARLPPLEDISEREVREYYDAHRAEFKEPERRRVLAIAIGKKETADQVLAEAAGASGQKWAELSRKYSMDRKSAENSAPELAGDLGFVSAPGDTRGENAAVPDEVRALVFELKAVGDVAPSLAQERDKYFVVRLGGMSPARDRTVAEADRTIRVELRRQKFLQLEKDFEQELRKKYPVAIDEKALADLVASSAQAPPPSEKPASPASGTAPALPPDGSKGP